MRDDALSTAATALMRGDASAAATACVPAGTAACDRLAEELSFLLTRTPALLADCPPPILDPLRIAAGLSMASKKHPGEFISLVGEYQYRFDAAAVAILIMGHAQYLARVVHLTASGLDRAKITCSAGPGVCPACRADDGRVFSIAAVPELPHAGCECEKGCGCALIAAMG